MLTINDNQRLILFEIIKHGGKLFVYNVNRKYYLSPGLISKTIRSLEEDNLIVADDLIINLTEKGEELVYKLGIMSKYIGEKPWRECPQIFKQEHINVNTPYIPRRSLLDKEFKKKFKS